MRRLLFLSATLLAAFAHAQEGSSPLPFRAVVLSDFNGPYGSTTYPAPLARVLARTVNEWKPDLFLSAGDVIGGQKRSLSDANVRAMWNAFDRSVAAPLREAGIPYAFAVGNHDGSSAKSGAVFSFARDRSLLAQYWNAPGHAPKLDFADRSKFPFAYSFRFHDVFFAVVDASSNVLQDRAWLEGQLSSKTAQAAAMRVVIGHLPLYGVSVPRNNPGNVLRGAEELRAMFEKYGVQVYVSGHHAAYFPGRRGTLNVLATGGIGGHDYVGFPGTARSTVTVADFDPAARVVRLTTYDAASGAEIDPNSLPTRINGVNGAVERVRDLR